MKVRMRFMAVVLAAMLGLSGCGSSSGKSMAQAADFVEAAKAEEVFDEEVYETETVSAAGAEVGTVVSTDRKLIRNVDLEIQTKTFDEVLEKIQTRVQQLGGYIEQSSLDGGSVYNSSYNRYAYMTVRIPSDQLDGFIENVKENANVTYISESTEDITLKYVDTESRKNALETEQSRLLELLEKAETVEDIITIESRLSEVRYQLESYTSQLRTYDNQVDYSKVSININEVDRETKTEPKSFWEKVTEKFGNSVYGIGRDAENLAIWFLGSSPYLVIWAVVIVAAVFVLRIIKRKKQLKADLKKMPIKEETDQNRKEN